jgi:hypothetical protein
LLYTAPVTLHIRNTIDDGDSLLKLSGRIQSDDLSELQELIATNNGRVALDLEEVNLVDRTVVEYLGLWEREGVELLSCPKWIREWISREAQNRA